MSDGRMFLFRGVTRVLVYDDVGCCKFSVHPKLPINEIMDVLYTTGKGRFMDTVERFHIYRETQENNKINDKNTVKTNAIFDVVNSHNPPRAHTE